MTPGSVKVSLVSNAPLIVASLLLMDSLHLVFARLLLPYLPPATSAMYVMVVATVEIGIFLAFRGGIRFQVFWTNLRFFLAVGFLVAGATALSYTAVAFIDPGTASLLAQTTTLYALGFSLFWLRERLSKTELIGALIAVTGVFIISFQTGDYLRLGSLIVLVGAFLYAFHAAVVKRYGDEIEFTNFFFFRVASIAAFLFLFVAGRGQLAWPETRGWLLLLLVGTVDVVFSRGLYYLALRRLRMSLHAILLTLSPAITILWSLLLFGTRPTLQGLIGGSAIITGVAIVTMRRRQ